eukprot:scaffold157293_cov46-Prasinocladus_malaysianus.AAC.2
MAMPSTANKPASRSAGVVVLPLRTEAAARAQTVAPALAVGWVSATELLCQHPRSLLHGKANYMKPKHSKSNADKA